MKLDLRVKLRQWMRLAYLFAQRRESRFRVHAQQYRDLHHELLHVVTVAASSADPQQRTVFQRLREALAPWINVESLTKADRDLLYGVLDRCETVRRSLGGGFVAYTRWRGPVLILIGAGVALGVVLVLWEPSGGSNAAADFTLSLRSWGRWVFATVIGNSAHRQLIVLGGVAVAITMSVVWYSARKY